jgi:uncharacterized protein (DUF58 family)
MADIESLLDDNFLRQLKRLVVVAGKSRKGPDKGGHRSWQIAEGIEFLDYRKYHPGDDLRYVDWSVYGRLDKLFIKLFHAEENRIIHVLLDTSRSMGSGRPAKDTVAKKIAAAVAYICLSNLDKIGIAAFAETIAGRVPPVRGKKNYPALIEFLMSLTPSGATNINASLSEYAAACKNPGIAVVISDLFDPKGFEDGLKMLTYQKLDISLIQIMDHEERFWSKAGNFILTDVETGEEKVAFVDKAAMEQYRNRVERFIAQAKNFCSRYGIDHYLYETNLPFEDFLTDAVTGGIIFR